MVRLTGNATSTAGVAICGASVAIFPTSINATQGTSVCSATETTITNSSGVWDELALAANKYDVRVKCGTSVRWFRYADEIQHATFQTGDGCSSGTEGNFYWGIGTDAGIRWSTADTCTHAFVIAGGASNQIIHMTSMTDIATDWCDSANAADTEVKIHSSTTPASDFLMLGRHTGTVATIDVQGGTTLNLDIAGTTEAHIDACGVCTITGNFYSINNTSVLNATTLGSGVVASSLTSVGTLTALTTSGNITLTNSGTATELRFREPSGSGCSYVSFKSPALAANVCYTLPACDGTSGQQLQTDGCGVLSWAAAGVVSLSGSTNNTIVTVTGANALLGEANLTFDGSTLALTGGQTISGDLQVNGGDITSTSGAIAFGNENLSTTGTFAAGATTLCGDLNLNGNDIDCGGVIFLKEQECANTSVTAHGQIWVDVATPNFLMFTNDAGTDFTIAHNATTTLSSLASIGTITTGVWCGTVITVAKGGTGATSHTDGGVLIGKGTGAVENTGVMGDGYVIVGDGTTNPVLESGATLRTSIGVGTGDSPTLTGLTLSGDLAVNGGDITSSSGAIAFGNENLSTTGTLASGALTVTGALALDGDLDFTGPQEISTTTGDLTLNPAASTNVILTVDDADAFDLSNDNSTYYLVDTRNTASGTIAHLFGTEDVAIASASGATYSLLDTAPFTVTFSGTTQVTTQLDVVTLGAASIAAGSAVTVNEANTLLAVAPTEAGSVTLTAASAMRVINAAGTPITQYGLFIEDLTAGATSDYGIWIAGADTAAIVIASADPLQLGVAGSQTGIMNWQGATSGTVNMTVAAAAGSWTLTLPANNGSACQVLQTDGCGVTSWATASGGPSQATESALESQTNEDTYAPPDLMHHHPGVAKVWADYTTLSTTALAVSYNVAGVVDDGAGLTQITIATDFSTNDYISLATANQDHARISQGTAKAAGVFDMASKNSCHTSVDTQENNVAAWGTQ